VLTGPEFGGQKNCVYIGMVTEDLDVLELVGTIAATGREIEENSRVCINKSQSISAPFFFPSILASGHGFVLCESKLYVLQQTVLVTVEVMICVRVMRIFVTGL